ncbi:MAG: T9SS type A sorting domain-containing protein [Bacteroidales bacterium]
MAVYRYRSFLKDSIRAVSICFNDSYLNANQRYFDLVVLEDNNGVPGDIIYTEEEYMVDPTSQVNGFATYYFTDPVEVNGYFFIGWRQRSETFLNAGLDMNTPHQNRQYYYLNGIWSASQVNGSLMIRPVMSKFKASGTNDTWSSSITEMRVWPNPARDIIYIDIGTGNQMVDTRFVIFDSTGRRWLEGNYSESVSISSLPAGIYFIETSNGRERNGFARFIKIR